MGNASGVSRGDRNRNARLARLRALVPLENAIVGIDLADNKQVLVVCDHDSQVLARRTFRCRAWDLGTAVDWAVDRAAAKGFAGVTVACEPTGHRWRVLGQLAAQRSMPFVCVQPMQTSWARRSEDLTFDKTDDKDGPHQAHRPRPTRASAGRVAHGVGRPEGQPRLRRPLPPPHHPRSQQAHPDAGADRDRRGDPPTPVRRHHHRHRVGSEHRHPRHPTPPGRSHRRLTRPQPVKRAVGASPPRH
jgi:hypothetical protein